MKKITAFFLLTLFFLSFPGKIFADSRCYYNGTDIGYMYTRSWHENNILVNGWSPTVWFVPNPGNVANNNEIYGKVGNFPPGWVQSDLKQGSQYRIWTNTPIPNDSSCGQAWVNVMWRSIKDGRYHYCNELVSRYSELPNQLFIKASCLANNGTCVYNLNPAVNKYYYTYPGGRVGFSTAGQANPQNYCSSFKLFVDNNSCSFYYNSLNSQCWLGTCSFNGAIPLGKTSVIALIQGPSSIPQSDFYLTTDSAYINLANYIGSSTCGGQIIEPSLPTPTPTPSRSPTSIPIPTSTLTPIPTPTPTCSPTDPSQPQLSSPLDSADFGLINNATLTWQPLASWGTSCLPASNNRFKVYLTSNKAFADDGDLTNEGSNLVCNVDQNTTECTVSDLSNK